jgi:hypothetical protein
MGSRGIAPQFLISASDWGEWSDSPTRNFTPGPHWIGDACTPEPVWTLWSRGKSLFFCTESDPASPAYRHMDWANVICFLYKGIYFKNCIYLHQSFQTCIFSCTMPTSRWIIIYVIW